jgi:hypothetical protein
MDAQKDPPAWQAVTLETGSLALCLLTTLGCAAIGWSVGTGLTITAAATGVLLEQAEIGLGIQGMAAGLLLTMGISRCSKTAGWRREFCVITTTLCGAWAIGSFLATLPPWGGWAAAGMMLGLMPAATALKTPH